MKERKLERKKEDYYVSCLQISFNQTHTNTNTNTNTITPIKLNKETVPILPFCLSCPASSKTHKQISFFFSFSSPPQSLSSDLFGLFTFSVLFIFFLIIPPCLSSSLLLFCDVDVEEEDERCYVGFITILC